MIIPLGTCLKLRESRPDVTHVTVDRDGVSHEHVCEYPYNRVVVSGVFALSPDHGGDEIILTALASHGSPLSARAALGWPSLEECWTDDVEHAREVGQRLDRADGQEDN